MSSPEDAPPERDVKDLRFQQLVKIRVSKPLDEVRTDRTQWLATANKYGLVFVVVTDGWQVFQLSDICRADTEHARVRSTHIIDNLEPWSTCSMSNPVSHLYVSSDELTLVVVIKECGNLTLCMFDVRQFAAKNNNPMMFARYRVNATPGASIQELAWNPTDTTLLAICSSDGSVELVKVTDSVQTVGSLPVSTNSTCLCWSPKGRQLVVGRKNGTLVQFDQEMKEKKQWSMPPVLHTPCQVVDVQWISTYIFMVAYLPATASTSDQPLIVLTVSSKEGATSHINFEDVCYGSGEERKHKCFFTHLPKWEMVLVSSSNATETAIIGKHFDVSSGQWEHWTLEDSGRAELPLTDNNQDSFPMGASVSLALQTHIELGENKTHPPSPVLFLLSTDGMLVPYYVLYHHAQASILTVSQEVLSSVGMRAPKGGSTTLTSPAAALTSPAVSLTSPAISLTSPGTSLGQLQKTSQGSTLPTTGTSFQFVTKSTQPSSVIPGGSLLTQSKTLTGPPSGSSFQFVAKPPQPGAGSLGGNLFAPVASQPQGTPASGAPKSSSTFSFTPTSAAAGQTGFNYGKPPGAAPVLGSSITSATTSSPAPTPVKTQPAALAPAQAPSMPFSSGQQNKSVFGSGSAGGTGFKFGTIPSSTAASEVKSSPPGLNLTTSKPATTAGSTGFNFGKSETPGFSFSKPVTSSTPVAAAPAPAPGGTPLSKPRAESSSAASGSRLGGSHPTPATDAVPDEVSLNTQNEAQVKGMKRDTEETTKQTSGHEKPWINETVESAFTKSIIEEMQHFEKELKDLKLRGGSSRSQVGGRQEMQELRKNTEDMVKFSDKLKETTRDQSREVHDQKALCLDLFAMAEECRVRQERNDDPHYHQLLRSRALDAASAEKLKQLQSQYQALEQGLTDVELVLDQQWEEYQDKKKAIKGRLHAPTSDIVYRAVKGNHNLVQTQKEQLDRLQEKLKNLQMFNRTAEWQNNSYNLSSPRPPDFTSLINALGESTPQPCHATPKGCKMSPEKLGQLRDFLSQRAVPRVKSTKPANLSMSRIVAAKSLREKLEEVRSPQNIRDTGNTQTKTMKYSIAESSQTFSARQPGAAADVARQRVDLSSQRQDLNPAKSIQIAAADRRHGSTGYGFTAPNQAIGRSKAVSSEELTRAMLQSKESLTYSLGGGQPDVEDISPAFTPELASDEQENYSDDEDYDYDDEEEEDEEEAGFGPEYDFIAGGDGESAVRDDSSAAQPSFPTAGATPARAAVSKNLFGGSSPFESNQSTRAAFGTPSSTTGPSGFAFGASSSRTDQVPKPVFSEETATGSEAKQAKESTRGASPSTAAASQPETKGFSFSGQTTSTSAPGFAFNMAGSSSSMKFGAGAGIFSKPGDSPQASSTSFSGFGGGLFGGKSEKPPTSVTSVSSSGMSTTAALNSSLLAALTNSATVTSASTAVTSAALGSSLYAALTDASSPAPQEAAAALSSFSFKPGESSSQETKDEVSSTVAESGSTASAAHQEVTESSKPPETSVSSTTVASGFAGSTPGSFGQPPKFSGSPSGATTTASPTTTTTSLFGSNPAVFGSSAPPSFGALATPEPASTPSTTESVPTTTSSVVKSLFGTPTTTTETVSSSETTSASATTTTTGTGFGSITSTASTAGSAFGTAVTSAPLFGGVSSTSTGSIFGGAATTTTPSSVFGTTAASTSASAFGSGTTGGIFGTPTTTASAFGGTGTGLFGSSAAATTTNSGFGTPSTGTATSGSGIAFGQSTAGGFSKPPAFGQSPGFGQTSGFGGGQGGGFGGSGGSVFGQPTTTTTASSSAFGQSSTTTTQSADGGMFGGGGGMFGGLGGKPSADKANKNVFGGGTFGTASTQSSDLFGGSGSSTFGSATSSGFGSGGFSVGSGVGSTGFGVSQTQNPQASGFGEQPSFGGSQALGSSTFGGKPTFGSPSGGFGTTATFSSPVGSTGSTFGGATTQQAGFASFASGNSPTFGNLAQSGPTDFGNLAQQGGGFGSSGGFGNPSGGGFGGTTGGGFGGTTGGGFGGTAGSGFGGTAGGGGGFGGTAGGGGFGGTTGGGFGTQPGFGSPQPGFDGATSSTGFGSSPQFTSYRG